jgi:hypothetical protein
MVPEVPLYVLLPSLVLLPVLLFYWEHRTGNGHLPFPRFQKPWEPTILARIRFILRSQTIIHEAYMKVILAQVTERSSTDN